MTGGTSSEYRAWCNMIDRCERKESNSYVHYGGRGISICTRWRESFENFLADMGNKPTPRHSLDRIDVDGNYEPGNCRWATRTQQARNTRTRRLLTVDGDTAPMAEWGERTGLDSGLIHSRLAAGWSERDAVLIPRNGLHGPRKRLTRGMVDSIRSERRDGARGVDLARKYGVSQQTICDVTKARSWPDENCPSSRKRPAKEGT